MHQPYERYEMFESREGSTMSTGTGDRNCSRFREIIKPRMNNASYNSGEGALSSCCSAKSYVLPNPTRPISALPYRVPALSSFFFLIRFKREDSRELSIEPRSQRSRLSLDNRICTFGITLVNFNILVVHVQDSEGSSR